jgi:hypothetical protein
VTNMYRTVGVGKRRSHGRSFEILFHILVSYYLIGKSTKKLENEEIFGILMYLSTYV